MKEKERTQQELDNQEVNLYASSCGKVKLQCETDCPGMTAFLSPDK